MSKVDQRERALSTELGGLEMALAIDPGNHGLILKFEAAKSYLNSYRELKTATNKAEVSNPRREASRQTHGNNGQDTSPGNLDDDGFIKGSRGTEKIQAARITGPDGESETLDEKLKRKQKEALAEHVKAMKGTPIPKRSVTNHTGDTATGSIIELASNSILERLKIK